MFQRVGFARVKAAVSDRTIHPFGKPSDLAGKRLEVLERNRLGDCLCVTEDHSAIVDVDRDDVESFEQC
jgi:hypothetical protein